MEDLVGYGAALAVGVGMALLVAVLGVAYAVFRGRGIKKLKSFSLD